MSVQIKKELDNGKTITYKIKFIGSFRFMSSKLSDLIYNLSEIYSKECRRCKKKKKKKIKPVCDFIVLKNNKLHHKWNECKKGWSTPLGGLIKIFPNTYKFCNNDINKSILLLRKRVYLYE